MNRPTGPQHEHELGTDASPLVEENRRASRLRRRSRRPPGIHHGHPDAVGMLDEARGRRRTGADGLDGRVAPVDDDLISRPQHLPFPRVPVFRPARPVLHRDGRADTRVNALEFPREADREGHVPSPRLRQHGRLDEEGPDHGCDRYARYRPRAEMQRETRTRRPDRAGTSGYESVQHPRVGKLCGDEVPETLAIPRRRDSLQDLCRHGRGNPGVGSHMTDGIAVQPTHQGICRPAQELNHFRHGDRRQIGRRGTQ